MKERKWSGRLLLRYALLQLPGLAAAIGVILLVRRWIVFADYWAWIAVLLWIAKDVVLFPCVWRAYDWDDPQRSRPMIGKRGRVREKLDPEGYVEIGGELWRAEAEASSQPIGEGKGITVVGMDGLLLIVKPDDTHAP